MPKIDKIDLDNLDLSQSLGQYAYEAYCETVDWKSIRGEQLPTWDEQVEKNKKIAYAWHNAAKAIAEMMY